jgi:predicted hydrocarbon binding protein
MNTWIKELLKNLDENLDEATKTKIMEKCGGKCPFTHLPDEKLLKIKNESSNSLDFIDRLSKEWRVKTKGKNIYVIFDKCYCPLVNEDISDASKTLCYCTLGNIKKKFRLGLGKDVKVLMEKTILAGDNECRFKILL